MRLLMFIACIVFFLGTAAVKCEVIIEDGGYSNMLVSFKHGIPTENGRELLVELQAALHESSEILQNAIGLRISKVTVNVPKTWDTSAWDVTVQTPDKTHEETEADILVSNVNDTVFGVLPYASQYGPCGVPGRQIIIPAKFLAEESEYPKGAALTREWLKYRYGVFDENGYPGDELYPLYYAIPGADPTDVTVTGCSNTEIQYDFYDNEGDNCTEENLLKKECIARPLEESIVNVTSSLMYFHKDVSNMKHVCGKEKEHPHSSRSRNKHNSMCQGQSIWDVMQSSKDFKSVWFSPDGEAVGEKPIEFTFIQEADPKIIITWENTQHLKEQGDNITNAIQKFMYDIPDGYKVSLFPYDTAVAKKDYSLRQLQNWKLQNDRIFQQIKSSFLKNVDGCVTCTIDKALEILEADKTGGTETIILITSSNLKISDDFTNYLQRLKDSKACLKVLIIGDNETPQEIKDRINELNCATLENIPKATEETGNTVFDKTFHAMESILPPIIEDSVTETVHSKFLRKDEEFDVTVDSAVEKLTFWIFRNVEDVTLVEIKMDDKKVAEDDIAEDLISDISALTYRPSQPGKVSLKLLHGVEAFVQVRATSKSGEYVSGEILTRDLTEARSSQQEPVILYANVRFGAYPVQNAKVTAVVSRPNNDDVELQMFDDGKGDPDITALDGVYSRYFTDFSEAGDYTVRIVVKNEESSVVGGKTEDEGSSPCCGQRAKAGTLEIPTFTEEFVTTFTAVSGRPEQGYKPSRIVDLRIEKVEDDKVFLTWTAPGSEADSGTVESYAIKYFTTEEDIKEFKTGKDFNFEMTPKERGAVEVCEVQLADYKVNSLLYVAIQSNNINTTSDTSNIVEFFMSEIQPTTTDKDDTTEPTVKSGLSKKETIGLVVGIILAVIVLAIITYVIVYFTVLKSKRKKEDKNEKENTRSYEVSRPTNENHSMNPVSFVSADTLIKHHNEKTRAKLENKEPPILEEKDFAQTAPTVQPRANNNIERPESSGASREPLPPKSPKRTTPV